MKLSIVIPTLNEAEYLPATLEALSTHASGKTAREVLVVDCGSVDGTTELARRAGADVLVASPPSRSRGAALRHGAHRARGDVLWFLDADTMPPRGYDEAITRALALPDVVGGAFELTLDGTGLRYRFVEIFTRIRYRFSRIFYGDQGVFVRADALERVGGYPSCTLMESAELCRSLKRVGRLVLAPKEISTSARRFAEGGFFRVLALHAWLWWLFLLRRPLDRHAATYAADNRRRGVRPTARSAPRG